MRTTSYRITPLRKSGPGNAHIRRFLLSWQKSGASTRARRNASRRGTGCSTGSGTAPSSRRCLTGWMIRSPKHSVLLDTRAKSSRATHHTFFIPLKHHRGEACHPKHLLSGDACYQVILSIRKRLPSGDACYPKCLLSGDIYHPEALTIRRFLLLGDAYRKKERMHLYWGHPLSSVIKDVLHRRFTSL